MVACGRRSGQPFACMLALVLAAACIFACQFPSALASAASAAAVSQGQWTQLAPQGAAVPGRAWSQAAASGGDMYVTGGDHQGHNATFSYNVVTNTWSEVAAMSDVITAGDMCASGGLLWTFGGKGTSGLVNELQVMRTQTTSNQAWKLIDTTNSPPPRDGHTTTALSGLAIIFGGWNEDVAYYNDLWAFDTSELFTQEGGSKAWRQLVPNGAAGSPPARNSASMVVVGGRLVLFGGFSHDLNRGKWVACSTNDRCKYYNSIWTISIESGAASPWVNLAPSREGSNMPHAVFPKGRWGHSAAAFGETMIVYGGNSIGTVVLDDTWMYSLVTNQWTQLSPPNAVPSRRYYAATAAIGGSLYIFSGSNGRPDLWRFTPPMNLVPVSTASPQTPTTATPCDLHGVNAGLVIAILLALGGLGALAVIYRKLSVMTAASDYHAMQERSAGL